jgi:hypothetical protein
MSNSWNRSSWIPSVGRGPVRKWRLIWAAELPVNTLFCAFCSFRFEPSNHRIFSAKNTLDRHAARCVRAIRWNRSSVPSEGQDLIRKRRLIWTAVLPVNTLFCAFCSCRSKPSNYRIFSALDTRADMRPGVSERSGGTEVPGPSEGRNLIRKRRLIWTTVFPVNTLFCAFCSCRSKPSNHRIFSAKDTVGREPARHVRAFRGTAYIAPVR